MIGMLRLLRVVVTAALIIAAAPVALVAGAGAVIRVVGHPAGQIASLPYPSDALASGGGRHHGHRQRHSPDAVHESSRRTATSSTGCSPAECWPAGAPSGRPGSEQLVRSWACSEALAAVPYPAYARLLG
jgi:hypothetical protein